MRRHQLWEVTHMKNMILTMLKDADGFLSGEELSRQLGVSRTAVWKQITKLKEEGYNVESAPRKGYRLLASPDQLTEKEIRYDLETVQLGQQILCFEEIDSTNLEIKRQVLNKGQHGLVVVAEEQTKGRGRKGRSWVSPKGTGIWMSILLKPRIDPHSASMLTLVAGLAVCESIKAMTGLEAKIKWPNDIVINGKKICGILTEMSTEIDHLGYVVLGIGINVNTEMFPQGIQDIASSIFIESGQKISRVKLLQNILKSLEKYYDIFIKDCDLRNLIEQYKQLCVTYQNYVSVIGRTETKKGLIIDITDTGELIMENEDGRHKIIAGEVSVRGMYGYV